MKNALLLNILLSAVILAGCCHCPELQQPQTRENKSTVTVNRTWFKAVVTELFLHNDSSYVLRVKITEISDEGKYPNLAVIGESYLLMPNFALAEDGTLLLNIKNSALRAASGLKAGELFTGEMFFSQNKGWFLDNFVKNEGN